MFFGTESLKRRCSVIATTACMILPLVVMGRPACAQRGAAVPAERAAELGSGQTTTPQIGAVALRGSVVDPDDAVIPDATITLTPASGKAYTVLSGGDGTYSVRGVPAGLYSLTITMPGFATFVRRSVRIGGGSPQTINAKLAIQDATQVVNVTTSQNMVSVDQDSNASSTVLKGKDLDALSDDPDELSSELSALAGPAAGPNGGQIYIDGFTGGQLPPKSSIREIRVNQNPFSAQYDRAGFGRVEVFTKPGTDKFHGSAQVNGQAKSFNTGSPFIGNTVQPDYHSVFGFGNVTGPISKTASFSLGGSYRSIQDNSIVNPPAIYATSQSSGTPCAPGTAGCSLFQTSTGNGFAFAQLTPATRWDISPRIDVALGEKNTLTARFQYEHAKNLNGNIGGLDLFSTGYDSNNGEAEIQISDTQIVSPKVINETRFEYQRGTSDSTPFFTTPTLNVQGSFVAGGNSSGRSTDVQDHIEAQNYTSVALAKHFLRLGGRLRTTSETNTTSAGANGTFTYNSISDYVAGNVSQYSITKIAVPTLSARSTDVGLYAEDDWKVRPNLTFSYGLRFETQNFIHDHADFAPRLSLAYALGKKTVIRAGAGLFYDRFTLGNEFSVYRNNGSNQQQYILSATPATSGTPTSYVPCSPTDPASCPTAATGRFTTRSISGKLRAPYNMQTNIGVDQQLFTGATLSLNYQHIRGVHEYNSAVANYTTLNGTTPIQYQYQSEGLFNQNQLVANMNYKPNRVVSFFGYYVLNFAKSDTSGAGSFASVPNNLRADYGRATFDTRNRVFMGGNVSLPHLVSLSPFLVATAGTPYNITAGVDTNGDTVFNDRAVMVSPGTTPLANGYVKTIGGCGTFATPGTAGIFTPAPINACTGPASFTVNLRAVKTIGFGAATRSANDAAARGGPGGPGGPGMVRGIGGGGGRPGGGMGGGGASSGRRYNLTLGAQISNLFNVVDRYTPVGTLSSPSFGTSTQLAGNIFTSNSAVRRITLQGSFSF